MTFFQAPTTSKFSRFLPFLKEKPEAVCAILLFCVILVHGATIGLTDDEAYYWVLAQKPALGYAYHPPMVAWLIAFSQAVFGPVFGAASAFVVRFPAALCSALVLYFSLDWLRATGVARERIGSACLVLVSFAALFALSWMMVPDISLFLGWMLVFRATWQICFQERISKGTVISLFLGMAISLLSKYSAVLLGLSSLIALILWAPRERRGKAVAVLVFGGLLASIPILLWNSTHGWASILYQIRDRHEGGSFSLLRWARFWAIEMFACGPALIIFSFIVFGRVLKKKAARIETFLFAFALPAFLVFCFQPLWADFKPHWALVVWWPMALALAHLAGNARNSFARYQAMYGIALGLLVLISCHVPVAQYVIYASASQNPNPKLDVTNDLYGWHLLGDFLRAEPGNADLSTPVIGAWYQTASQAWFALGKEAHVSLMPLDLKSRDEWPDLGISKTLGPEWPELTHSIYFVADNRYADEPGFSHAHCKKAGRVTEDRAGHPAKWIDVWKCDPDSLSSSLK